MTPQVTRTGPGTLTGSVVLQSAFADDSLTTESVNLLDRDNRPRKTFSNGLARWRQRGTPKVTEPSRLKRVVGLQLSAF